VNAPEWPESVVSYQQAKSLIMSSTRSIPITAICFSLVVAVLATVAFDALGAEALAKRKRQDIFLKLAKTLATSGDIQRRDFAWIAVSEVTRAYEKALEDSASETPTKQKARYKLIRWRQATRELINELHRLLHLLSTSAEIRLYTEAAGLVLVLVNNKPIVICGPELTASRLMERRIIDAYCGLHDCEGLLVSSTAPTVDPKSFSNGIWIFKNRQSVRYETPDGLVFLFSNLSGRIEKQQVCDNVAKELRVLVADLRAAKRAGFFVDWDLLEIRPLAGRDASHVLLNKEGDYLRPNLAYLEKTKLLKEGALAWVRKMVEGKKNVTIVIQADHLMHPGILSGL